MKFINHVDSKYKGIGKKNNRRHKIPIVITGCIYYHYFYEQVKDLTCDELGILSKFSAPTENTLQEYEELLEIFTKGILSAIATKTPQYDLREEITFLVEGNIKAGQTRENMIEYVAKNEIGDILAASHEYQKSIEKGMGKSL